EQVERLAHHAQRGELWQEAVGYLQQAGAKAAATAAYREAVGYFRQALVALGHLAESPESHRLGINIRVGLFPALLGEVPPDGLPDLVADLREAEGRAAQMGDQRGVGHMNALLALFYWHTGDYSRAVESGQRALAVATALGDSALQVRARMYLGQTHWQRGDYRRAVTLLAQNAVPGTADVLQQSGGFHYLPSAVSLAWIAASYAELGEFVEGIAAGQEALRMAEAVDSPFTVVVDCRLRGQIYLSKGDLERAIQMLERALEVCQARPIPFLFAITASRLGRAYALAGNVAEAASLLKQAIEQGASVGRNAESSLTLSWLAEAY